MFLFFKEEKDIAHSGRRSKVFRPSVKERDNIIESLKRRIKKLEEETKQRRGQLKVAYAEVYKMLGIGTTLPSLFN
ncbi:hypothetical protein PthBH41_06670 [Parageobacillus thermoglucosidasius]|nr:hypothetical protein Geoth_0713 [Parageobacillus thermoglucosidasius C56-YS93]EID45054.1 hypothetical protein GT20_0624 [Parageobacillus thermoglucosidasius TNO-09.020]MBY6268835.1 hypothetical protein [Parageobacillus thermoglucosidasius]OUM85139.1 MAG: hypothetical protein BAA00_04040 [Parageobacillus thermoglucosidasius]RDE20422.1 hypothetical protein DV714_19325 [Parageobacillus thermoglucosidasius]